MSSPFIQDGCRVSSLPWSVLRRIASHGRGRWFETTRARFGKSCKRGTCRIEVGRARSSSRRARLLFPTGRPMRYLPKTHVRIELLISSDTVTQCPYEALVGAGAGRRPRRPGLASPDPNHCPEGQKMPARSAFHNEKVDI